MSAAAGTDLRSDFVNKWGFPVDNSSFDQVYPQLQRLVAQHEPLEGNPKISVSPKSLNFGSLKTGSTSNPKTITIRNTGKGNLKIYSIIIEGTNASEFNQSNDCSTIFPGDSCSINVIFSPTVPFIKKSATIIISSNYAKKPTVNVKLSGQAAPPKISVSPKSLNFGTVQVGNTSPSKIITVKNTGISDLEINNNISISGANADEFSQTSDCTTVSPSGSCTVNVTFTPTTQAGTKSAIISISSNYPKKPTVNVKIKGKAVGSPRCTYTYSEWGPCQPNNTQTRTVISSSPAGCAGTPVLSQSCIPTLISIAVTPANPSISVGASQQFTATGTYSDSTTHDITTQVTWSSSNTSVATINSGGLATGLSAGSTIITASLGGISGNSTLTTICTYSISATSASFESSGGSGSVNITTPNACSWAATSNASWITITSGSSGSGNGTVAYTVDANTNTNQRDGTVTIAGHTFNMTQAGTLLPKTLVSISVTPVNLYIAVGATQQFTAVGTYSDGSTNNITSQVIWSSYNASSSDMPIATVDSNGITTGLTWGISNITATLGSISGHVTLMVGIENAFKGSLIGSWSGTCGNIDVSGGFSITIDSSGNVTGSYDGSASGSIMGIVSVLGIYSAAGGAGSFSWLGILSVSNNALSGSGTWNGSLSGVTCTGTWSGQIGDALFDGSFNNLMTYPEPVSITYSTKDNITLTVNAFPGQVVILSDRNTSSETMTNLINSNGGTVVAQIPNAGLYLAIIDPNILNSFLSAMYQSSMVIDAFPNGITVARHYKKGIGSNSDRAAANSNSLIQTIDLPVDIGCGTTTHEDAGAGMAGQGGISVNINDVANRDAQGNVILYYDDDCPNGPTCRCPQCLPQPRTNWWERP